MGGIILLVAYNLIDLHHIRTIIKTSREETAVLLATFFATLFLDLEFAIYIGVFLSLVLYLNRTAHPRIVNLVPNTGSGGAPFIETEKECPYLKIIRIDGPLFFGAVNHVSEYLYNIDKSQMRKRNVLIIGWGINFIDVAGAELLAQEARRRRGQRGGLYLCEFQPEAYNVLERGGYLDIIGRDHFFVTQHEAINKIVPEADEIICRYCKHHVFKECPALTGL
jgi:SulP family sulfate permease